MLKVLHTTKGPHYDFIYVTIAGLEPLSKRVWLQTCNIHIFVKKPPALGISLFCSVLFLPIFNFFLEILFSDLSRFCSKFQYTLLQVKLYS